MLLASVPHGRHKLKDVKELNPDTLQGSKAQPALQIP